MKLKIICDLDELVDPCVDYLHKCLKKLKYDKN